MTRDELLTQIKTGLWTAYDLMEVEYRNGVVEVEYEGKSFEISVRETTPVPAPPLGSNGREDCDWCEGKEELCDGTECQK